MCECCSDKAKWLTLEAAMKGLGLDLNYCPVCSSPRAISEFLYELRGVDLSFMPETVTDENGNELILDRQPPKYDTPSTPVSLEVNLDKIDISREVKLLKLDQPAPTPPLKKATDEFSWLIPHYCPKCGKEHYPTPLHRYKDSTGKYCSWTCFNHREEGRAQRKMRVAVYSAEGYSKAKH